MRFRSLGWKDPWRREWQPTPVFFLGESHGQRSLVSHSPWCHQESDMTERPSMNTIQVTHLKCSFIHVQPWPLLI